MPAAKPSRGRQPRNGVQKLGSALCGGGGVGDGQPDGPVAEVGHEVQPAAECFDVAGDDLNGGDLAVLDLGYRATLTPMAAAICLWPRPSCLRVWAS